MLKSWLAHPLTRNLDIDDPQTTYLRQRVIQEKIFLKRIYEEWYRAIIEVLPSGQGLVLELGAGGGFLRDFIPDLIASELFYCPNAKIVMDGLRLPLVAHSLRAMVMTNVFHHLPQIRMFLVEAARCVRPGGVIAMTEPWVTPWSRVVYKQLHHEPFEPEAAFWELPRSGPLSGGNNALPWIIFARDRAQFEQEFPQWRIEVIQPIMPFRYLISGGVSMRKLMPGWSFGLWRQFENVLSRWNKQLAMFAQIVLRRCY